MKEKKKLLIAVIAVAAVILISIVTILILARNYFMGRFPSDTIISNTSVSAMTVEEATEQLNLSEGFSFSVTKKDKTYNIVIENAVKREFDSGEVQQCLEEITFFDYIAQKKSNFSLKPVATLVSVDKEVLREILEKELPKSTTKNENAYFDKKMNLVSEVQGDVVDIDMMLERLTKDIIDGNELYYILDEFYVRPEVTSTDEDMVALKEEIDAYKNMTIIFKFGKEKEKITGKMIAKNMKIKNGKVVIGKKWIEEFVRNMAREHNTYGKTRKFKTTKDGVVKITGGILGWWINEDETVKKIQKLLKKKKSKTTEPIYRNGAVKHGNDDVGNTYVEISLERQKLWFYKNGKKKLTSDVVTGLPTADRVTVKGVHRIYGKQKDRWLGTIAVQGYRTHVNYWMPFNWDGQGLHDAPWRHGKFGGTIYKKSGSHGCVNMPEEKAAKLYDLVSIGTPVVVY